MNIDATKLQTYIDYYWHRPSDDDIVWLGDEGLHISWFIKKREKGILAAGLNSAADAVVFLIGDDGDDLCMIDGAYQNTVFKQDECVSRGIKYCVLWKWKGEPDDVEDGLNDCTAFVTHALYAAGLTYLGARQQNDAWAIRGPAVLYKQYLAPRPISEVKTLALDASGKQLLEVFRNAASINLIGPGDLLFLKDARSSTYFHTLLLTPAGLAPPFANSCCHTIMNHADVGSWKERTWDLYFQESYVVGTLIHFAYTDPVPQAVPTEKAFKIRWTRGPTVSDFKLTLKPDGTCHLTPISKPKVKVQTGFWFDVAIKPTYIDVAIFWTQLTQPMNLTIRGDTLTGATVDGIIESIPD